MHNMIQSQEDSEKDKRWLIQIAPREIEKVAEEGLTSEWSEEASGLEDMRTLFKDFLRERKHTAVFVNVFYRSTNRIEQDTYMLLLEQSLSLWEEKGLFALIREAWKQAGGTYHGFLPPKKGSLEDKEPRTRR